MGCDIDDDDDIMRQKQDALCYDKSTDLECPSMFVVLSSISFCREKREKKVTNTKLPVFCVNKLLMLIKLMFFGVCTFSYTTKMCVLPKI